MKKILCLGLFLFVTLSCKKENPEAVVIKDVAPSFNKPVSLCTTSSGYYILGTSYESSRFSDIAFLGLNRNSGQISDKSLMQNQDENYRERAFKIKGYGNDFLLMGWYQHWDYTPSQPWHLYFSSVNSQGQLNWGTNMRNFQSISNNFHIVNDRYYIITHSFPAVGDYYPLHLHVLKPDGQIESEFSLDSAQFFVNTSVLIDNNEIIVIGDPYASITNEIKLYSLSLNGKLNWDVQLPINDAENFRQAVNIGNEVFIIANEVNHFEGTLYTFDLSNRIVFELASDPGYYYFNLISNDQFIYILKGKNVDKLYEECYLDIYSAAGSFVSSTKLTKYVNVEGITMNFNSTNNIVVAGNVANNVLLTELNPTGVILN